MHSGSTRYNTENMAHEGHRLFYNRKGSGDTMVIVHKQWAQRAGIRVQRDTKHGTFLEVSVEREVCIIIINVP